MKEKVAEEAGAIAEKVAGKAMITVSVLGYALGAFQETARMGEFSGLARAYNRRRAALEAQHPDLENEQIHQLTVKEVREDPYQDSKGNPYTKYGNLLENKDCQNNDNPHCIDNRVFWTAMDGSYKHKHSGELTDRLVDQVDRKLQRSNRNN